MNSNIREIVSCTADGIRPIKLCFPVPTLGIGSLLVAYLPSTLNLQKYRVICPTLNLQYRLHAVTGDGTHRSCCLVSLFSIKRLVSCTKEEYWINNQCAILQKIGKENESEGKTQMLKEPSSPSCGWQLTSISWCSGFIVSQGRRIEGWMGVVAGKNSRKRKLVAMMSSTWSVQ